MTETTKTLQRWDCHHEYIEPVEGNEWGDWVSYDDAAKLLAEVERLRAALRQIAGEVPFADDPWKIARDALEDGR